MRLCYNEISENNKVIHHFWNNTLHFDCNVFDYADSHTGLVGERREFAFKHIEFLSDNNSVIFIHESDSGGVVYILRVWTNAPEFYHNATEFEFTERSSRAARRD